MTQHIHFVQLYIINSRTYVSLFFCVYLMIIVVYGSSTTCLAYQNIIFLLPLPCNISIYHTQGCFFSLNSVISKSGTFFGIEVPPEVEIHMRRIGQLPGRETLLECQITGFPMSLLVWRFNNQDLSASKKHRVEIYDEGNHRVT